ncbi:filamentous haemagglutinin family protein [Paraburkholderia phenazinium]|uniref:Filamentous hemagglutinin family N-terminal domain-containing protein n=1 Tax=Paraburkholderia phenazinium TaxID=60549 RepID=A0A1N6GQ99_9BURK|nr:filamentous haemagglutinin family protein [Paraburkholderia phenazinium]SIO09655.1 filamentous hemagglutinin family N-terminal domain-containing protein [Paraburkholderia phenazinium]
MKARGRAQKQTSPFPETIRSDIRPLCRAIAMVVAASAVSGAAHAAGLVNLSNISSQSGTARAAAGTPGLANLGVGVSPQQALQSSAPSIRNLATAAQGIAQQIAAQQAAAAAGATTPSNVPNGLAVGGLQVAPGITFVPELNGNQTVLVSQNTNISSPLLWVNAYGPQQTVNPNGSVTVNVQQTSQNAVATWQTMNVGKQTTLNFDQSGGTQSNGANNWIILNRIEDPSGAPSQILGNITAQGTVLVINRNGILFGAGSQVNVHSLLASSLDLLNRDDYIVANAPTILGGAPLVSGNLVQDAAEIVASNQLFLNLPGTTDGGLAALEAGTSSTTTSGKGNPNEILGLGNNVSVSSANQLQTPGNITIAPGASITTSADGSASDGGFVLIAAPNVNNAGSITVAPAGQVVLAAGIGVSLIPETSNPQVLIPLLSGRVGIPTGTSTSIDITPAGSLVNTGIIRADRGNIDLLGSSVAQNGVVGVTTSVNTPGNISISTVDEYVANTPTGTAYTGSGGVVTGSNTGLPTSRAGQLTFGPGSVTAVLPDTDGETATSTPGESTFTPGGVSMTAGSVWFQSGSLVEAPGSTVSVVALTPSAAGDITPPGDTAVQGRIYLDTGAIIDVSGRANVELPISDILLDVGTINENDLANSPLLRNTFLNGLSGVVVDSTLSGTSSDGVQWVGSPILNLAGAVDLMPRTVDQLLINGGTITLSGNQVMTADGSSLNLNGGYIHYLGGVVNTTRLVDANGAIVPIGEASPYDTYVGIAGEFVDSHPRWGITNEWFNPLLSGGAYESDYIVGGNAGTLNVFASQAMVLDGDITAQSLSGEKQVQGNDQSTGGSFNLGSLALASLTQGPNSSTTGESGTVILQGSAPELNDLPSSTGTAFTANTPLDSAALGTLSSTDPQNVLATTVVPVNTLNSGGFANVSVTENGTGSGIVVAQGTQLAVQPGGSIKFVSPGAAVSVLGSLIAPSGVISISTGGGGGSDPAGGGILVGPDAVLSVAGQWVNNDVAAAPGTTLGDSEYINGGTITLTTGLASAVNSNGTVVTDRTGSIVLQSGSVVDVSSGGEIQSNGQMLMQNGIPDGTGGSLAMITYSTNTTDSYGGGGGPDLPTTQPTAGQIVMDGTIKSMGFAGGGTLTLQAPGFQIGGDPAQAPAGDLYLPTDFFAQQGFGKYILNALYDATVAPGATVQLTQQNLLPDFVALQQTATGADITAAGLTTPGTLDPYHRQATSLVMTGGAYLDWENKAKFTPDYAGVTGGVTVGAGASIVGDAGASIGLGSPAQVTVLGSIVAPGGSITLSADSGGNGFAMPGQLSLDFTSPSQSVWLGPNAVLDVAGVALTNPLAAPVKNGLQTVVPDTGKVLPGGSVTISDDSGYVVAQAGSVIDVSGTSANFDELQSNGRYASQQVWSDAGSITLGAASGLMFDGTLQAQPGAAQAQGGTLTILPDTTAVTLTGHPDESSPGAQILILQQSGNFVPAGLMPGQSIAGVVGAGGEATGVLQFAADRLTGSGIGTLVIGILGNSASIPVAFAGNVDLNLSNAVEINTPQITALSTAQVSSLEKGTANVASLLGDEPGATAPTSIGSTVTINAPYVALIGTTLSASSPTALVEAAADSTLNVNASFIDLENQFELNNFGQANFTSSGDIRLSSTNVAASGANALAPGELFTPGNLTFKAADLYPSTGSAFILDAVGPTESGAPAPTTITFLGNGSSGVPLSAGGALLVDATDIVQAGTVRAPSGSLIFGVGNTTDTTTQSEFNALPLVATNSVSLANGSVTSVSLDGTIIPYGTTVDGVEWQFNPIPGLNAGPDVTAPPAKFVSVNGSNVSLDPGATVDLSGGGDLQAEEWVSGTGGTRDVLSQYNISYATSTTGTAVPVNVGAANVYAILPGAQSSVAAYDPVFAQTTQPQTGTSGTVGTITDSIGVGKAALNVATGTSVYLSGVPGLAAGYYTLLPAEYATLPGAYRVTVSSSSGTVTPGASMTLPDGTVQVAGYTGNALTGTHSATPTVFDVQSSAVWQQYSQYTLTSANSFFPPLASSAGDVTPPLPMDAGQLVLAAAQGLTLGGTLKTAAAPGGAPAEVDIASQAIQIVGSGEAALPGYLQISAGQLDALDAGSLLLGGIRTQTTSGVTIDPVATSVVLSNDAANPLSGPEVMLVSANTVQVDSGSVIAAQGAYPAAKDAPITISANAATNTSDGALLIVTNGADSVVTRSGTVNGTGLLTVGAGATLTGGQALTLDSSGNLSFDPAATLSGNTIAIDGSAISFTSQTGAAAAALPGFVAGPTQLAQLANAQDVILRSTGTMYFDGTVDATFGKDVDLSAGSFSSNGGAVTINAQEVAFTNEVGATVPTATMGSGTLTVNAGEIDFGTGDKTTAGFGSATFNATGGIVGQGNGSFGFGAQPVTLNAPIYLADTGSSSTLTTTGTLNLNSGGGTALTLQPLGGAFSFIGGTVNVNGATIDAPAGNVSMEATSGNLNVNSGSTISSAGFSFPFFDITEYVPAGSISLTSDVGSVNVAAGSTLNFSGANGGGTAGSLTLSAPDQTVNLAGTIKGNAASGYLGGSFSLNTGGAVDLDNLSNELASSGVNDAITVQTNAGNLTLSAGNTLTAHVVSLTADGGAGGQDPNNGNVQILGTIDASGNAGGIIDLYGKSGVNLQGSLIATGSSATEQGGTVNIGTTGNGSTTSLNSNYGYENVLPADSGVITVGNNALIDVSGGTAGGLSGGTVNFRAPILTDGTVNVTIAPGAQIKGSRATTLAAYAVWSTDDQSTNAAQHFDGIVDPAGWYDSSGNLVAGTFTSQDGTTTITYTPANGTTPASLSNEPGATAAQVAADLALDLETDYFAPASGAADTNHQVFYGYQADGTTPGTLMGFVEKGVQSVANQFAGTNVANFAVAPGIDLDNPDPNINGGNISILTNWNLGAGSSPTSLAFRFDGQAPIITFRAENNVEVKASLTDGFFQIANPTGTGLTATAPAYSNLYTQDAALYTPGSNGFYYGGYYLQHGRASPIAAPASSLSVPQTSSQAEEYYGLYSAYLAYLLQPLDGTESAFSGLSGTTPVAILDLSGASGRVTGWTLNPIASNQPTLTNPAPSADDPAAYLKYLATYNTYLDSEITYFETTGVAPNLVWVQPPPLPVANGSVLPPGTSITVTPAATENSPSPVATAGNILPLLTASLNKGNSSTFNVVAGANLASANPLALQAAALFSASSTSTPSGSVILSGNFAYDNANNPNTPNDLTLLAPTMIRTGTGSISVAAANDVWLFDPTDTPTSLLGQTAPLLMSAPGVIYTAGAPALGAPLGSTDSIVLGSSSSQVPDLIVTSAVNPDGAGNVSIVAQNNITGMENVVDATGAVTGKAGQSLSQFWWQWMEVTGTPTVVQIGGNNTYLPIDQTSIDFGAFDQGVMSVGGNVSVSAGGNISDLAVSLPTTWYLSSNGTPVTVGGGNLTVSAAGNILSGDYFVAKGTGTITAGGQIAADFSTLNGSSMTPVATLFATQDGVLDISARQGVDIGGVLDPSYVEGNTLINSYRQHADFQGYSSTSAVNVSSTTGDIDFGTLSAIGFIGGGSSVTGAPDFSYVLPATVNLTAFTGGITVASGGELYPSVTGNLSLIADQSINLSNQSGSLTAFGMLDIDPSLMPSPTDFDATVPELGTAASDSDAAHAQTPLHEYDPVPARIYSLTGSIVDGFLEPPGAQFAGFYDDLVNVVVDKPASIEAGLDIVNLSFEGQNLRDDDVTRVVAGRDIYDTPLVNNPVVLPNLQLGGPGYFDVEAGRNIGPLTSQLQVTDAGYISPVAGNAATTGIDAVGNANNPELPHESANVEVLFGVGPGIADANFISTYINPSSVVPGITGTTQALIAFMEQYDEGQVVDTGLKSQQDALQNRFGTLDAARAWAQFQTLPAYVQQLFVEQVFFSILTQVGNEINDPTSQYFKQYARGFQAINTLFPASLGYTANDLGGGANGANAPVQTGNLDIRGSTIQTQQGGNISILGPGGEALVGSSSAPPATANAGPGTQGILTLEQGDIDIFTDQSLLLAQSRVFTEQGGNMTIWSSNGNIDAGKGSTTVADVPPPEYVCDANHFCTLDAKGEVTGAGIATLQTIPGAAVGNVNLLAPRGIVDAGAAGIRVSGDLNVAALQVLNAANIQTQGKQTGVPTPPASNAGALTAASAATSAVTQIAQNLVNNNASGIASRQWVISVEVEGFGDDASSDSDSDAARKRKQRQK